MRRIDVGETKRLAVSADFLYEYYILVYADVSLVVFDFRDRNCIGSLIGTYWAAKSEYRGTATKNFPNLKTRIYRRFAKLINVYALIKADAVYVGKKIYWLKSTGCTHFAALSNGQFVKF